MGEYTRINKMIRNEEKRATELRKEIDFMDDCDEREILLELLYETENSIGELKGTLYEMAECDGLDDYGMALDY